MKKYFSIVFVYLVILPSHGNGQEQFKIGNTWEYFLESSYFNLIPQSEQRILRTITIKESVIKGDTTHFVATIKDSGESKISGGTKVGLIATPVLNVKTIECITFVDSCGRHIFNLTDTIPLDFLIDIQKCNSVAVVDTIGYYSVLDTKQPVVSRFDGRRTVVIQSIGMLFRGTRFGMTSIFTTDTIDLIRFNSITIDSKKLIDSLSRTANQIASSRKNTYFECPFKMNMKAGALQILCHSGSNGPFTLKFFDSKGRSANKIETKLLPEHGNISIGLKNKSCEILFAIIQDKNGSIVSRLPIIRL